MRKLSSILLPVIGLLYPFFVYFGMEHVSTPVFALILGAVWLIRAPALLRQPGGHWMLGAALAYCALLALSGESQLLRWYPTLVCALLLLAFGLTLRYGPPMIERIARVQDPQLPAAAVPYTRKVTWLWMGFFAANALASAALTLWAPLRWWTLYNGLIAYLAMGALFAGEFAVRTRVLRQAA